MAISTAAYSCFEARLGTSGANGWGDRFRGELGEQLHGWAAARGELVLIA